MFGPGIFSVPLMNLDHDIPTQHFAFGNILQSIFFPVGGGGGKGGEKRKRNRHRVKVFFRVKSALEGILSLFLGLPTLFQIVFSRVGGDIRRKLLKDAVGTLPLPGFPLGQVSSGSLFPLTPVNAEVNFSAAPRWLYLVSIMPGQ